MTVRANTIFKRRMGLHERVGWGIIAAIGYILSPLSWWNDGFVNIPLSLLAAKILSMLFGVDFVVAFYTSYTASNIIGMVLLYLGASGAAGKVKVSRGTFVKQVLIALVYSIAMYPVLKLLGLT
jgi:hypothetical protein